MSPDPARDPAGGPSALDNGRCEWCGEPLSSARRAPPGTAACDDCGSWTTHPAPTAAELQAAYGAWYRPTTGRFAGPLDRLLRRARERLANRIDELAPPGPVLDVGSGDGALLDAIERRGRQASGLERAPSSELREFAPAGSGSSRMVGRRSSSGTASNTSPAAAWR